MADKNSGNYVRDQVRPEFTYDGPSGPEVGAVGGVGGVGGIGAISGGSHLDPIAQWRSFSEQLRARRLAHDALTQSQSSPESGTFAVGKAYSATVNGTRTKLPGGNDQVYQKDYELDQLDVGYHPDPVMLGLQRHLATVNHPLYDEHIKEHEHQEPVDPSGSHELRVGEVMTRKVVCVLESTTIEQMASICNRRGFSGVPVINMQQGLVGIVTLSDVLHQILNQNSVSSYAEHGGVVLEQKAIAVLDEPVRNYMHRQVLTVSPDVSVKEACQLMMQHHIRRLVVTHGDTVRGIFSAQDAVRVLATADLQVPNSPPEA